MKTSIVGVANYFATSGRTDALGASEASGVPQDIGTLTTGDSEGWRAPPARSRVT